MVCHLVNKVISVEPYQHDDLNNVITVKQIVTNEHTDDTLNDTLMTHVMAHQLDTLMTHQMTHLMAHQ